MLVTKPVNAFASCRPCLNARRKSNRDQPEKTVFRQCAENRHVAGYVDHVLTRICPNMKRQPAREGLCPKLLHGFELFASDNQIPMIHYSNCRSPGGVLNAPRPLC